MKLNESYKIQPSRNDISTATNIRRAARESYLSRNFGLGWFLTNQLTPEDGECYIDARLLASRVNAFYLRLEEATRIARELYEVFPKNPSVTNQLIRMLTHGQSFDEAWLLQRELGQRDPENLDHYQGACILAGKAAYTMALKALRKSLLKSSKEAWSKVWYDPELILIWDNIGGSHMEPGNASEIRHPIWRELLDAFDPHAPFDALDPGNLTHFDERQMLLISFNPETSLARLRDEDAIRDPDAYSRAYQSLSRRRLKSFSQLKMLFNLLESAEWQASHHG